SVSPRDAVWRTHGSTLRASESGESGVAATAGAAAARSDAARASADGTRSFPRRMRSPLWVGIRALYAPGHSEARRASPGRQGSSNVFVRNTAIWPRVFGLFGQ